MYSVSSDTLVELASGLSGHCVKKQCGLVKSHTAFGGRMALDLRLSRVRMGVAAMIQDYNYQLDITKLGRKRKKRIVIQLHLGKMCAMAYWLDKEQDKVLVLNNRVWEEGKLPGSCCRRRQ